MVFVQSEYGSVSCQCRCCKLTDRWRYRHEPERNWESVMQLFVCSYIYILHWAQLQSKLFKPYCIPSQNLHYVVLCIILPDLPLTCPVFYSAIGRTLSCPHTCLIIQSSCYLFLSSSVLFLHLRLVHCRGWQGLIAQGCHSSILIIDPKTAQTIQVLERHKANVVKVSFLT